MRTDISSRSPAGDAVVLAAATVAEALISGRAPNEEAVFAFVASVISAARRGDHHAAELAWDLARGLEENLPPGQAWAETRGQLSAVKLVAWLLLEPTSDARAMTSMHAHR